MVYNNSKTPEWPIILTQIKGNSFMAIILNPLCLNDLIIQIPQATHRNQSLSAAPDHLTMTKEKLDYAVEASKRILQEAASGKLPNYV